jgi:hypothetical protein
MVALAVDTALLNVFALLELGGLADGRECPMGDELGSIVLAAARRYRVESIEAGDGRERE